MRLISNFYKYYSQHLGLTFSFRDYKISLMSGKLNKEEQIQVVIRIKPVLQQSQHTKSVYLSEQQQRTLVVQTPNKKEYFVFDSIADETCTQSELYNQIGKDALTSSIQGYNCCIFAYGQTGAGKTHSILGATQQIATNIYCESRGILPRLLGDIFSWCQAEADQWSIRCSYMQIYNEQIYDLLNTDQKLSQIRQDIKKGVYVEGLSEERASNYEEAMTVLLKGVKNRKVFATSMNSQSSRSHTIFTLNLETEIKEDDSGKTRSRKSKLNIVDLAGSERAKLTKVEGDRLKEGCNINKSLHVLGNVINALVQSSKRKKHIPFRDSKLTYYLKDSLCGNSITKLLANIHPSKAYLGDTLSTLMFAKRAKILKMKVEPNQNVGDNFEQLRKQIRKLREELKEARYIKNQVKAQRNQTQRSSEQHFYQSWEKIVDTSGFDYSKNENALQVFQENEQNYKALIEIYEQHMKICSQASNTKKKPNNMHHEWKVLQKKNETYKNLLKNMPAFTKIFKENVLMKEEIDHKKHKTPRIQSLSAHKLIPTENIITEKEPQKQDKISKQILLNLKEDFQKMMKEVQEKFTQYINTLENQYNELQHENRLKDAKIKELCRRKQLPPDMQQLVNENQYLKLNIMQLENDIAKLADRQTKYQIQIKELRKQNHQYLQQKTNINQQELRKQDIVSTEQKIDEKFTVQVSNKMKEIETTLQSQLKSFEEEREQMCNYIDRLKEYTKKLLEDCKSNSEIVESVKNQNKNLRNKINSLLKIENEGQILKVNGNTELSTFWTNQQSNFSEEFDLLSRVESKDRQNTQFMQKLLEKEQGLKNRLEEELQIQRGKILQMSSSIVKLHQDYGTEISKLKEQIQILEKSYSKLMIEKCDLQNEIKDYSSSKIIEQEIKEKSKNGKSSKQINQANLDQKKGLSHAKSYRTLSKVKEEGTEKKLEQVTKKSLVGNFNSGRKSTILKIKEEDHSKYASGNARRR